MAVTSDKGEVLREMVPTPYDQEQRELKTFLVLVFRGDLTHQGKINLLEDLQRKYPRSGYGELAHTLRVLSTMTVEEREALFQRSLDVLVRRSHERH